MNSLPQNTSAFGVPKFAAALAELSVLNDVCAYS